MLGLVTTAPSGDLDEARRIAGATGLEAQGRAGRTLDELRAAAGGAPVLVLAGPRADLYVQGGEGVESFRASAGMAFLRFLRARKGEVDPLVAHARLIAGEVVFDATLGLGGDALLAAQAVGPTGRVLGVERDPVLAAFALAGLQRLPPPAQDVARRIEVRCGDHRDALAALGPRSVDIVLLDPMFRSARRAGPLFSLLRARAVHEPLDRSVLDLARRAARRGVLVKDANPARELGRLGLQELPGRRAARILFGWLPGLTFEAPASQGEPP